LDQKFKGQALARLETYAGKMDLIKVAAADATEVIGKGLVDALMILSKDNSIQSLSDDFSNLATNIASVIVNLAKLTDKIGSVVNSPSFKPALILLAFASKNPKAILFALGYAGATGAAEALTKDYGGTTSNKSIQSLAATNLANKTTKARKEEYAIITASNKARNEIDKLKDKFDLERIGLLAALNSATDEETKLRIKAQIAILDNNEALAKKYNAELEAAKAANDLANSFKLGGLTWLSTAQDIKNYIAAMTSAAGNYASSQLGKGGTAYTGPSYPNAVTGAMVTEYINAEMARITDVSIPTLLEKLRTTVKSGYDIPSASSFYGNLPDTRSTQIAQGMAASPTINVNVEGSVLALSEMDNAIQDALLRIYKQNGDLAPAGFIP
jgi:hypothetical protein